LKVTEPSSTNPDVDTKIIYINSRTPEANFTYSVPFKNKPNTVLLDATKSYDPDFSDE
jgi:PKD repeat protein